MSGKPDWNRMTTAVLKNRLLDITGREFYEGQYGALSFRDFVLQHSEALTLDESQFPPIAELRAPYTDRLASELPHGKWEIYRVRPDLWKAAVDYSSGTRYVWDAALVEAKPATAFDNRPSIDTITLAAQRGWRSEFAAEVQESRSLTADESSQIQVWAAQQLGTSALPSQLIPRWGRVFRDKVHDHLRRWFQQSGLEPPRNLTLAVKVHESRGDSYTDEVRRLAIDTVRCMTREELYKLSLPIGAILRSRKLSES